jgi:hypothetical protein
MIALVERNVEGRNVGSEVDPSNPLRWQGPHDPRLLMPLVLVIRQSWSSERVTVSSSEGKYCGNTA